MQLYCFHGASKFQDIDSNQAGDVEGSGGTRLSHLLLPDPPVQVCAGCTLLREQAANHRRGNPCQQRKLAGIPTLITAGCLAVLTEQAQILIKTQIEA